MTTTLGILRRVGNGYTGKLRTLAFSADIDLVAIEGGNDKAPDYRIFHKEREIGAGWIKRARRSDQESDQEYVSLKLQDLALGSLPVFPVLVQSERDPDTWNLLLNGREQA